jgi:hypothetical protein
MAKTPFLHDWQIDRLFGRSIVRGARSDTGERIAAVLYWQSHGYFGTQERPTSRNVRGDYRIGVPARDPYPFLTSA